MTIATTSNKVIGQGNGATTNWPFSFLIPDQASLIVLYTDANGAITILTTAQYSVTGLGDSSGGAVTYPLSGSPIALGTTLTIVRDVAYVQQSSIKNQGGFFPDVYESALDYLTMQTQQLSEALGRAIVVPITTDDINTELPTPIAGAAIGWSADGTSLVNIVTLGGVALPLAIAQGGTGQQTKATAAAALGIVALTGAGGTANAQTANAPQNYAAFVAGDLFVFVPSIANTGATQITITPAGGAALAAKAIFQNGAALAGGELKANVPAVLQYDGVQLNIVGPILGGSMVQGPNLAASSKANSMLLHGQCQLTKSGANLLLSPFNGNKIIINSNLESIPDAGVTLAPPAVASTTYYIYAFMNAGVMTLENSATAPAVQAGTGVKIKNGDATRTLVGQARTTAGNAWADSATQRFVRSWFNDPGIATLNTFSADRSASSATYVELNTEIRCEFLVWTGEVVRYAVNGTALSAGTPDISSAVGFDGTAAEAGSETLGAVFVAGNSVSQPISGHKTGLAEGYHYATLLGKSSGGTASTWSSVTDATHAKNYLHVAVGQGTP